MGLVFKLPKNGKVRTIILGAELAAILRSHRAAQAKEKLALGRHYTDSDLVFAMPDGQPVKPWNFGAAFKNLVMRSGVSQTTLHDLRDTHASLLAKAGVPIEVVSSRLGHSGIAVTVDRYLTVYTSRDADAANAFELLLENDKNLQFSPNGIRTRVTGLRTRRPRPLDDRAKLPDLGSNQEPPISETGALPVKLSGIACFQLSRTRLAVVSICDYVPRTFRFGCDSLDKASEDFRAGYHP